jgi:N-acetylglutamate synthase
VAETTATVRLIEELAANAWPAEIVQHVGGWRFRRDAASARRANSVWPNSDDGTLTLEAKLALAEEFYARHGGIPRFQMCPASVPADLDDVLAAHGYTIDAPTAVQTAPLEPLTACTPRLAVKLAAAPSDEWFAVYCEGEHARTPEDAAARRSILHRIGPEAVYAAVRSETGVAAVGMGVIEREHLGIFGMVTRPEHRRRGAATSVLAALARAAAARGAYRAYLQVMEDNAPALALYASLGFSTLYRYHYRERR